MARVQKMSFAIDRGHGEKASVDLLYSDGSAETRAVDCRNLLESLSESLTPVAPSWCTVGSLPEGYINAAFDGRDPQHFRVAVGFPGKERLVRHYDKLYLMPMPRVLMIIEAGHGRFSGMWAFAVRSDGVICRMPVPNVYRDGKVCWGSNETTQIKELRDCDKAVSIFFDSVFNHDLYSAEEQKFGSFLEELEALKDKKSFPDEWLIPVGDAKAKLTEEDALGSSGFVLNMLIK